MSAVDRLKDRALALDAPGLEAALRDLDDDQRAQARAWVLAEKQFFATVRDQEPQITRSDDRAAWAVYGSGPWMRIMCLVAVCSPAEAARAVRWGEVWGHMQPIAREHARRLLADRPREWAQTFLTTTAGLRLSKRDANRGGGPLAWLVYGGLADHDLPCPEGRSFLEHSGGFSRHDPEATAHFRANRLNPDQVYLKIAAGFAADYDALPEAVGDLIGDGNLDRDELLETCLQSLTNQTRVGSQRVVAKILKALDLRPADIPGGLAFLTGVIATCDGSVGAALLPLTLQTAIETAGQAADGTTGLEELTRVIAGRKERGQKQVLLSWLRDPATVAAVGVAEARVALEVLGADQDDASLLRGIEAGLAELGAPDSATARQADVLGLWYLDLAPGPARERPWWMREERGFTLAFFLNRRHEEYTQATQYFVDEFVQSLAADHGVDQFVALCKGLRVDGSFALTRCIGLIESAFLAGGLRIMWPAAVDIADDVASAGRTPAGLPELLRLLTRYAPEVPDGSTLPLHLAQLAAAPGNTKSQLEARALGAALTRVAAADYTPGEIDETATVVRGLWELRPPGPVLGLLLDPYYPNHHCTNDDNLKYLLAIGSGLADRHHGPFNGPSLDANVVRELATAVQTSELEAVRARFARSPRLPGTDQGPTWRALELWLSGHLTPQTYDDVLAADRAQGPALDRVVFAWTCEQLARLATHPGLMSRPAMTDGTVLVPKLANQLRSFAGIATVGPLDLLLTLTRLRVTPEETDSALEALGEVPSVWTDPDVTRTATGVRSFDVLPVIRAWIGGGGMTETDVPIDLGQFTGVTELDMRGTASHQDVLYRVWPREQHLTEHHVGTYSGDIRIELQEGRLPADAWGLLLAGALHESSWQRETSLTHIRELARFDGVLDETVTVPVALSLLAQGQLPLGRLSDALQWLFERGGLRELWPLGMAVAGAASGQAKKPNGLASLLSALTVYAPDVPAAERRVSPELAALAGAASASKSRAAAIDLVSALAADTLNPNGSRSA